MSNTETSFVSLNSPFRNDASQTATRSSICCSENNYGQTFSHPDRPTKSGQTQYRASGISKPTSTVKIRNNNKTICQHQKACFLKKINKNTCKIVNIGKHGNIVNIH